MCSPSKQMTKFEDPNTMESQIEELNSFPCFLSIGSCERFPSILPSMGWRHLKAKFYFRPCQKGDEIYVLLVF